MLIALITDLHTGVEGEHAFDIDLRQNLKDTLHAVQVHPFDFLVVAGDLCLHEGRADIYKWQKSLFDKLDKPYHIIAGNHDDQQCLCSTFTSLPLSADHEIFYDLVFNDNAFLFLDTARGITSINQKKWLTEKLNQYQDRQILVFMHHPPALMGVPHMDEKHAFSDREEIIRIFGLSDNPIQVFCGHYHVQKSAFINNVSIHITPSLFFQINPFQQEFSIDHKWIAYRLISMHDASLYTSVHYLRGNTRK